MNSGEGRVAPALLLAWAPMSTTTAAVLAVITLLAGLVMAQTEDGQATAISLRPRRHPVVSEASSTPAPPPCPTTATNAAAPPGH